MRYNIVWVSCHLLVEIFIHGSDRVRVIDGLPADAKYVRNFPIIPDHTGHGRIGIVVESQLFDKVEENQQIPEFPPIKFEKV